MKKLRLFDSLKLVLATVACMFAIVPAHAATLPAGYTELEYIHFVNGVGNIKTGIIPTSSIEIETKASFASGATSALAYNTGLSASSTKGVYWQGTSGFGMNVRNVSVMVSADVVKTIVQNRNNVIVDGLQYNYSGTVADFVGTNELYIGGLNSNKFSGDVYSFVVRFDGVMERNFVPARRDSDNELGFYDTVHFNFYTNQGSGSFTAGPDVIPQIKIATTRYNEEQFEPVQNRLSDAMDAVDDVVTRTMTQAQQIDQIANEKQTRPDEGCPAKYCLLVEDEDGTPHWYPIAGANGVEYVLPAGYTQLEYIESNGTQYINTGIYATQNTAIETKFINLSGASTTSVMIGDGWSGGKYQFSIVAQTGAPNRIGGLSRSLSNFWTTNREFIVQMNKTGLYVDGELLGWYGSATEFTSTNPLTLLGDSTVSGRGATVKLFYMKIYENDTMVRNFIPAKNASDVVGMYDTVSGQFFTKSGNGDDFTSPDM